MNSFSRLLVLLLLIVILFALYRYQQKIIDNESAQKNTLKKIEGPSYPPEYDNISQISLGSLADLRDTDYDLSCDSSLATNDPLFF
jgi:hypothetical protein